MIIRKIFGLIFIIIAILLSLAIVGQLPQFIGAILGLMKLISGRLDSYQTGRLFGHLTVSAIHIGLMVTLYIIGFRWLKKPKSHR